MVWLLVLGVLVVAAPVVFLASAYRARRSDRAPEHGVFHEAYATFLRQENRSRRIRAVPLRVASFRWERAWLVTQVRLIEGGGESTSQVERTVTTHTKVDMNPRRIRRRGATPTFEGADGPVVVTEETAVTETVRRTTTPRTLSAENQVLDRVDEARNDHQPFWPEKPGRAEGTGLRSEERYEVRLEGEAGKTTLEFAYEEWAALAVGDVVEVLQDPEGRFLGRPGLSEVDAEEVPAIEWYADPGAPPEVRRPAFLSDDQWAAAGERVAFAGRGSTRSWVFVFRFPQEGEPLQEVAVRVCTLFEDVEWVALSADGALLIAPDHGLLRAWRLNDDGTATRLWTRTAEVVDLPGSSGEYRPSGRRASCRFSPDGKLFAVDQPSAVLLLEPEEGRVARILEREQAATLSSLAFHAHEPQVATAWSDGFVVVWDPRTGDVQRTYDLVWGSLLEAGRYREWAKAAAREYRKRNRDWPTVAWTDGGGLVAMFMGVSLPLER